MGDLVGGGIVVGCCGWLVVWRMWVVLVISMMLLMLNTLVRGQWVGMVKMLFRMVRWVLGVLRELTNLLLGWLWLVMWVVLGEVGIMLWLVMMGVRLRIVLSVTSQSSRIWWFAMMNQLVNLQDKRWIAMLIVWGIWCSNMLMILICRISVDMVVQIVRTCSSVRVRRLLLVMMVFMVMVVSVTTMIMIWFLR